MFYNISQSKNFLRSIPTDCNLERRKTPAYAVLDLSLYRLSVSRYELYASAMRAPDFPISAKLIFISCAFENFSARLQWSNCKPAWRNPPLLSVLSNALGRERKGCSTPDGSSASATTTTAPIVCTWVNGPLSLGEKSGLSPRLYSQSLSRRRTDTMEVE